MACVQGQRRGKRRKADWYRLLPFYVIRGKIRIYSDPCLKINWKAAWQTDHGPPRQSWPHGARGDARRARGREMFHHVILIFEPCACITYPKIKF